MTLINKATRLFLIGSLISSIFGGILCYIFLKHILNKEATEQLLAEKNKVEKYVKIDGTVPENIFSLSDSIWSKSVVVATPLQIRDTTLYNMQEHHELDYREMSFCVNTQTGLIQIHIRKALYESEDLTEALLIAFAALIVLLISMLFLMNYVLSRTIWKPFYETLNLVNTFKINQAEPISFNKTQITEFTTLQTYLLNLTNQVRRDYQNLKTFTENASHELQTPLAVIGSNLELLIQDKNLTESQLQQINSLIESIGKLSKLNQTLLLLTKIENRQFADLQEIDISATLIQKLNLLDAWIQHKSIEVVLAIKPAIYLQINKYLLDVLLNNIIGNAIKYNLSEGKLLVELTSSYLLLKNTGHPLSLTTEQLFERFQKDSAASDSLGLGLAIVKQICDTYQFQVSYSYLDNWHTLKVSF